MLLMRRVGFSPQGVSFQSLVKQNKCHMFSPISYKVISEKVDAVNPPKNDFLVQSWRSLHVTHVDRDLESGLKALGAGIAATGVIGSGIGLGIIFGNFLTASSRNPSMSNKMFGNAIMGAAFCESLGLFAVVVAFVILM